MGKALTNYNPGTASTIPFVPQLTEFFDTWPEGWKGKITRTWILFFEKVFSASQVCLRTLLIKDTTIGVNIADNVPIYKSGTGLYVVAVLRSTISADLVVDINLNGTAVCTITIPSATPVYPNAGCVIFTDFNTPGQLFSFDPTATPPTADVLGATITASDGSIVADGVASFTVLWQADAAAQAL